MAGYVIMQQQNFGIFGTRTKVVARFLTTDSNPSLSDTLADASHKFGSLTASSKPGQYKLFFANNRGEPQLDVPVELNNEAFYSGLFGAIYSYNSGLKRQLEELVLDRKNIGRLRELMTENPSSPPSNKHRDGIIRSLLEFSDKTRP
jgi:hypothetical protein